MMKLMQVFDCQDMPNEVKRAFFDDYGEGKCNDVYIMLYLEGDCPNRECINVNRYQCDTCEYREYNIVEKWLMNNGATDGEVIVKRWW